jgi:hypothetical protein
LPTIWVSEETIEAGLVVRELPLRKKAKTSVVAAPPWVLEAELEERFGLVFELLARATLSTEQLDRAQ